MNAQVKDFRNGKETFTTVKVGDSVGFKSDFEQSGTITKIERSQSGRGWLLHLHSDEGFGGEYLRYAKDTIELASDCWID